MIQTSQTCLWLVAILNPSQLDMFDSCIITVWSLTRKDQSERSKVTVVTICFISYVTQPICLLVAAGQLLTEHKKCFEVRNGRPDNFITFYSGVCGCNVANHC